MNNFLAYVSFILAVISIAIVSFGLVHLVVTTCKDKQYWTEQRRVWARSSYRGEQTALSKSADWLKEHDGFGYEPSREFPLRDFSAGIPLVISRVG